MKLNKKIFPTLIIFVFLSGFGLGFLISQPQPLKAQAAASPVKIHNLKFRKLVKEYLLTHKVPGKRTSNKMYTLSEKKVDELMRQLDRDGYFTQFAKRSERIVYLETRKPEEHRGVLLEHLKWGFEAETNYQFYTGNLTNTNTHTFLDWMWRDLVTKGLVPLTLVDIFNLDGASTVKSLAFDRGSCMSQARCRDMTPTENSDCLTRHIFDVPDNCGLPRLRSKNELSHDAIRRLYNTPLFINFRDLGYQNDPEWHPEELDMFNQVLGINEQVINLVDQGYDFPTAIDLVQMNRYTWDRIELALAIITGGAAKGIRQGVRGFTIPEATEDVLHRVILADGTEVFLRSSELRIMTEGIDFPESLLVGDACTLRGETLDRAVGKIFRGLGRVEEDSGRKLFQDWQIHIVDNLRDPRGLYKIYARADLAAKKIAFDQDGLLGRFGHVTVFHEGTHVLMPNMRSNLLAEAFIDFQAQRWTAASGFPYPPPSLWKEAYQPWIFNKLHLKLVDRVGRERAAQMIDDFVFNPLSRPDDLDNLFGSGFSAKFKPLLTSFEESQNIWLRAYHSQNKQLTKDTSIVLSNEFLDLTKEVDNWVIP